MELVVKLLTVLGLGAIELWAAIPAGLALRLHPVAIAFTATVGAPLNRLLLWISLGIVLWSAGLTLVGALGLAGIEGLW